VHALHDKELASRCHPVFVITISYGKRFSTNHGATAQSFTEKRVKEVFFR